ncbi:MAG: hypothetical protein DRN14_00825 [Thermoplasmata archaeon]|nr:MAG: hypothetical protein DRN14_00825 [Thermoplasmata archaeon]HDJ26722.1 ribbon-helix-helix protein, CopG family [Aciduliprofundum sp.]
MGRMADQRITVRLDENDVEELERFLRDHPEFRNKSELMRRALMTFIKTYEFRNLENAIVVPTWFMDLLRDWVNAGLAADVQEAANVILTNVFTGNEVVSMIERFLSNKSRLFSLLEAEKRVMRK